MSANELNSHLTLRRDLDDLEDKLVETLDLVRSTRHKNEMLIDHFNTDENVISSVDFHRRIKK